MRPSLQQHLLWKTCSHPSQTSRRIRDHPWASLPSDGSSGSRIDPSQDSGPAVPSVFSTQPPSEAFGHSWSLLPDPSALPWSWHCRAEGCWSPRAQKKGKNSLCSERQELGELHKSSHRASPLTESSREASPKNSWGRSCVPHNLGALPTSSLAVSPPPLQENLKSLLSCKASAMPPSFLISQFGNKERKMCGHTEKGSWKKPRYHFSKVEDWWASLGLSTLE